MKNVQILILSLLLFSCDEEKKPKTFTAVSIETLYEDAISIRAIEIIDDNLAFAANKGFIGSIDLTNGKIYTKTQQYDTILPEFRAIAHTDTDVFVLSVANPALLFKTGDQAKFELVYIEENPAVFYNAMTFWNNKEGIAVGDSMEGCLSIIITRDGGLHWDKLSCDTLPEALSGEGAFAASNTNIVTLGAKTWIATTKARIFYSPDKGKTWKVFQTPILNSEATQGIYSIDFYDQNRGFAIGGDYTKPDQNQKNKAITTDGGKTWRLVANGMEPDYKSCVQFVPNSNGTGLVAVGFTGISYSSNGGIHWEKLSKESFYTLRFKNDSVAYAAGKNRVSKLLFR